MNPKYESIPPVLYCACGKPIPNEAILAAAQTIHAKIITLQQAESRGKRKVKKEAVKGAGY